MTPARIAHPTRHLTKGPKRKRYVDAARTDIRRTFRRARLLAYLTRDKAVAATQEQTA